MGTLNISLATEYTTPEARQLNNAMYFNGVMRRRFWLAAAPRIAETHGFNRQARYIAGALMRKAGISVPVETPHEGGYRFEVDPDAPLGVRALMVTATRTRGAPPLLNWSEDHRIEFARGVVSRPPSARASALV